MSQKGTVVRLPEYQMDPVLADQVMEKLWERGADFARRIQNALNWSEGDIAAEEDL